jgi:hypothetical protein
MDAKKFNAKEYYLKNKQRINEYNREYWKTYYIKKKRTPKLTGCVIRCNVTVTF